MAQDERTPVFTERVRDQLLNQRILVLDGVLDDDNGTLLATQLLTLAAEDPGAEAALWINSPGGSVPSMLAIRDVMRLVPCDVSTLALGLACSAYLGTGIDPGVANALIAQLLHLEAESPEQEVSLYINCEGGDLPSMLAVYDTMQYIQAPVATTCVGQAIGVGAVLLAAGAAGLRTGHENQYAAGWWCSGGRRNCARPEGPSQARRMTSKTPWALAEAHWWEAGRVTIRRVP